MTAVVGRISEKKEIDRAMNSSGAELIVVYGRRRVGKTFLIREHLRQAIIFELTGLHNEPLQRQLESFALQLRARTGRSAEVPHSWLQAFAQLKHYVTARKSGQEKKVLFFDEFPWLATRRSGFLAAFEEFWNSCANRDSKIACVICGSAASWMISKVVNAKGGLHNRATARIRLEPFSLRETREYLHQRRISLNDFQIAQIYMILGGVPHYLQRIERGKSAAQNIDALCFAKDGLLTNEFSNLYRALFDNSEQHEAVVRALAAKRQGLTRSELATAAGLKSGGTLSKVITELTESGFIRAMPALYASRKNSLLRLVDEYSLFYLCWIENNRMHGDKIWLTKSSGQKWKSWCGYAFENVCLKHIAQIKHSLGISGVLTEDASWHVRPRTKGEDGAQVDLVIDRNDQCINLCEMKFTEGDFVIDKRYAAELTRKLSVFREGTRTRKSLFLTMVTSNPIRQNEYAQHLVSSQVTLDELFR